MSSRDLKEQYSQILKQINKIKEKYSIQLAEAKQTKELEHQREKFMFLMEQYDLLQDSLEYMTAGSFSDWKTMQLEMLEPAK